MGLFSDKITVRESGLLDGFWDCHCHLLPGVDDGVKEMDETLMILEEWELAGMREGWMTPHIMEDIPNMPEDLKKRFEKVKACYKGHIKLRLAAEHMMDGPFVKRLEEGSVMPFGPEGTGLLVETSYYTPPMNMGMLVDSIKRKGYDVILAHPERYQYMDTKDYRLWKEKGVLMQLNVPALTGAYGPEVQKKAEWLLKENMYDYCGTDTHSITQMDFFMNGVISKKRVKMIKRLLAAKP